MASRPSAEFRLFRFLAFFGCLLTLGFLIVGVLTIFKGLDAGSDFEIDLPLVGSVSGSGLGALSLALAFMSFVASLWFAYRLAKLRT